LTPGSYTLTANAVPIGTNNYCAIVTSQTVDITAGVASSVQISYSDIIHKQTLALDSIGAQTLTVSSDRTTLTMSASSPVAQSLLPGDVLAIGVTPATPNGLIRNIVSVSTNGNQVTAITTQATFANAFQQASFSSKTVLGPQNIQKMIPLRPGVKVLSGRPRKLKSKESRQSSLQDPCTGNSATFVELVDVPVIDDEGGSISLDGEIEVCPSLEFDWSFGGIPPQLNSLNATVTFGGDLHVNVTGRYNNSFDKSVDLLTIEANPIVVFVGPVPIVVTPELTFFVGVSGDVVVGFSAGVEQTAIVTAGVTYSNGQTLQVFNTTSNFATDPFGVDGNLTAKGYAGVRINLNVDEVLSAEFSPDAFLQLDVNALNNPLCNVSAGLEGSGDVKVGIFGIGNLVDFEFPNLFQYSQNLQQLNGGCLTSNPAPVLSTINPSSASVNSPTLALTLMGSNFVPGATASFNGVPLSTSFSSPTQITASLPGSDLLNVGNFPVSVTNPDTPGATSGSVTFTVTGNVNGVTVTVSPTSAQVQTSGSQQFTATVMGTNNTAVTWSVDGINGGNSTFGTISTNGLYMAPNTVPNPPLATVTATSQADPTKSANAGVTIIQQEEPAVTFSPNPVLFGNVQINGGGSIIPVTMQNTGNATLQISQIYVSGTQNGNFTETNNCPNSLPAQGLCTISVTFNPAQTGQQSATLSASDNAPGSPQSVSLNGMGTSPNNPIVTFSPNTLDFSNVETGGSGQTLPVTMQNTGTATLQIEQIYINGAQNGNFTETNSCGSSLPVQATCTISVTFNPSQTGQQSAALQVSDNAPGSPQSVPLSGTGVTVSGVILSSFTGQPGDGNSPQGTLIQANDGNFYGTTISGGSYNNGTVFRYEVATGKETVIHSFNGPVDGNRPLSGLIHASDGNLYGTTQFGGTCSFAAGTVFRIDLSGENFATIHCFDGRDDGAEPWGGVIQGRTDGYLYGTTYQAGPAGGGTAFKMDLNGNILAQHPFAGSPNDGGQPTANLVQGADGNFYGTTLGGGTANAGTIFMMDSNANVTVIHSISSSDGVNTLEFSPLVQGIDGSLYGEAQDGGTSSFGAIFKVNVTGNGFSVIHSFAGPDGALPAGGLIQTPSGTFYGTTQGGGGGQGDVFQMDTSGDVIRLYSFQGAPNDGSQPVSGVIGGVDGNLYGTTLAGGTSNDGTIFKIAIAHH
jgi:uncharacterized repeat protein (TIGR03803 family)